MFVPCLFSLIELVLIDLPTGLRGVRKTRDIARANLRMLHPLFNDAHPASRAVSYQRRTSSTSAAAERTPRLTHIDASGHASMVDVSAKAPSTRTATARGRIHIPQAAYELITEPRRDEPTAARAPAAPPASALETAKRKARAKGDVLTVAQLAGIMGCKRTAELIPLCHPLALSHIAVSLHPEAAREERAGEPARAAGPALPEGSDAAQAPMRYSIVCVATVTCEGKTGVEMEALTAVSVGLLTVWDMLKAVAGKEMVISDIAVIEKRGGKSGDFRRDDV